MKPNERPIEQDEPLKDTGDLLDTTAGARQGEKNTLPEGAKQEDPPTDSDENEEAFPPENQRSSEAAGEDFS
jgi:hypothetical protein